MRESKQTVLRQLQNARLLTKIQAIKGFQLKKPQVTHMTFMFRANEEELYYPER